MSRGAEDAAGEGDDEGHKGEGDGHGPFLGDGPVHGVFGVVGAIPFDKVGIFGWR